MNKKSTLNESSNPYRAVKKEDMSIANPRKETLSFLKQFARIYHAERKLPAKLAGMILN